ncbi:hypothetical protein PGB90_004060 [Kerria lacca]
MHTGINKFNSLSAVFPALKRFNTHDLNNSILEKSISDKLREHNIKSVFDFFQETSENICNITKLSFKEVLDIKQKLLEVFRGKPISGFELFNEITNNYFILCTGISEIDKLIGGLESGGIYEICGLSSSGKTQICLGIAAHVSNTGKCVHFIDTKGDFSAKRIFQILIKKKKSTKEIIPILERIKVNKIYNLYQLINILHGIKNLHLYYHIPLIIIDCISTSFFMLIGSQKPVGSALLGYAASLMKFITSKYHTVIVVTNLATKYFSNLYLLAIKLKYKIHIFHLFRNSLNLDFTRRREFKSPPDMYSKNINNSSLISIISCNLIMFCYKKFQKKSTLKMYSTNIVTIILSAEVVSAYSMTESFLCCVQMAANFSFLEPKQLRTKIMLY